MEERSFAAGETIYDEGDISDNLYIIRGGEVEVSRRAGDGQAVLGILKRGQFFGETGIIRDRARSTTTRAISDVNVVAIGRKIFLDAFNTDNPIVLPLLRMLCERLSAADQMAVEGLHTDGAPMIDVARVRLLPASHQVETQIGADGVVVKAFPYRVGRRVQSGAKRLETDTVLALVAPESNDLSPEHFAIGEERGALTIRDLGSYLGTLVNGQRIASFEHGSVAGLRFGDNQVVTGGADSPYRFRIIVEKS